MEAKRLADWLRTFSARVRDMLHRQDATEHLPRVNELEENLLRRIAIWPDLRPIDGLLRAVVMRAEELPLWQADKLRLNDFFAFYTSSTRALLERAVPLWSRRPLRDRLAGAQIEVTFSSHSRSLPPERHVQPPVYQRVSVRNDSGGQMPKGKPPIYHLAALLRPVS